MSLDTGSNLPLSGTALRRASDLLVWQGFRLVKQVRDSGGLYSYLMTIKQGVRVTPFPAFYLVARDSAPMVWGPSYMHVVSTQKALLTVARDEGRPVLMALFMTNDPGSPVWMLFNPEEAIVKSLGENRRGGIVMVNYEYDLGMLLMYPRDIPTYWGRLEERWKAERGQVQTRLGGEITW